MEDAEALEFERTALRAERDDLLRALRELVEQVERPNSEWDNIRIAAQEGRAVIAKVQP